MHWSMTIEFGRSCLRGVRFSNVKFDGVKLVSPPHFGEVTLHGSGFVYSPRVKFSGRDEFSLEIVGVVYGRQGRSIIHVTVSDIYSKSTAADTTPPSVSFTAPSEAATISGSEVALTAIAVDDVAVADVQFFLSGKKIGSIVASRPYTTVWDSTTVPDGFYTLYVVARDTAGNFENSWVHVTVKNQ